MDLQFANFYEYYNYLADLIYRQDWSAAEDASLLLSCRHSHCDFSFLQVPDADLKYDNRNHMDWIVFDHISMMHLHVIHSIRAGEWLKAYEAQNNILQLFNREVLQKEKDTNWFMPLLYTFCSDLRLVAREADKKCIVPRKTDHPSSFYEDAAAPIMESYRICVAEGRVSTDATKRVAILNLTNQLFRIYFRINRLHLLKPLIRSIDHVGELYHKFSLADRVTYKYYLGRKAMFDMDLQQSEESLMFAFNNCPVSFVKNKRLILMYLIPVKMFLGHMPTQELLKNYNLEQFSDVVSSVKEGNLRELNNSLLKNQHFFIKCGIFLMLEKLKIITYRNIFKRVASIMGTHQIKLEAFLTILRFLGSDMDLDELSCILANLIAQKKIKGYISFQKQTLVVSKQQAFPNLSSV